MTSPGRLVRTLRHVGPRQLLAQVRHVFASSVSPIAWEGAAPQLHVERAVVGFPGAPRHAHFDGGHEIELLNRRVHFHGAIDWSYAAEGPLWTHHLHQFDYARRPGLSAEHRTALLLDWIARHREGFGWNPHPIALRVLSWGKLLLTPGALALDAQGAERVHASLASQLETLARNLELRLRGNHLFSDLLALVFGGLMYAGPAADRWLDHEASFRRELAAQIGPDGAHEERSPMYHSLLLENVLDLVCIARSAGDRTPPGLCETLEEAAAGMLGALRVWTHPDGEIALFGDSAFGIAHPPAALAEYAASLGLEAKCAHAAEGVSAAGGYVRLEAEPFVLLASVAGPSPAHQPGHAHCDALAFELSVGDERAVTDTGVCQYTQGPERSASRATRSHATAEVGGHDQAEVWSAHRVGGRPRVVAGPLGPGCAVEASCAGWATPRTRHRRVFRVGPGAVEIEDELRGPGLPVRFAFPFAPHIEPVLAAEPEVRFDLAATGLRISTPECVEIKVEKLPYFPEFGLRQERSCLVGSSGTFRRGTWRFELEATGRPS